MPDVPLPSPEPELLPLDRAALTMARRYHAVDDAGRLRCVVCRERPGQLPHLCCPTCITAFRRGLPLVRPANDGGEP